MSILVYLIPVALLLGGIGLAAFLWSLWSGQYDDLDGAAMRILLDDPEDEGPRWNDQETGPSPAGREHEQRNRRVGGDP